MKKINQQKMYEQCLSQVQAERTIRLLVAKSLDVYHLTMMEWLTLGAVSRGDRNGLSMTEIARKLDVTLPQVTVLVAGLLKLKLVKQKILVNDHRGRQVFLTLRGKRLLHKLESKISISMRQKTKNIPHNELQIYLQTVEQLAQNKD